MAAVPQIALKYIDLERLLRSSAVETEGVRVWPFSRLRTRNVRDELLERLISLHNVVVTDPIEQLVLRILGPIWTVTVLQTAYTKKVAQALVSRDTQIICGPRHPALALMIAGTLPPMPSFARTLAAGPPRYPPWRWPLRLARQATTKQRIVSWPFGDKLDHWKPVTLSSGGLINAHAEAADIKLRFHDPHRWFSAVEAPANSGMKELVNMVTDAAKSAFDTMDVKADAKISQWLEALFRDTAYSIATHAGRLRARDQVPGHLWIGSSTDFWSRLLGYEVLHRGGKVVAHDHGFAGGFVDEPTIPLIVNGFCSKLVTFEERLVHRLQHSLRTEGFKAQIVPDVVSLEQIATVTDETGETRPASEKHSRSPRGSKKIESVMILPLALCGEYSNIFPYPDDVWAQDINLRLVRHMRDTGLQVFLKPHPEFTIEPYGFLETELGAHIVEGKFEDTAELADVVIFTHPLTSTMRYGLEKCLRMILIDFGFVRWFPEMKKKLQEDVKFVEGFLDDDNRLQYDKDGLTKLLV